MRGLTGVAVAAMLLSGQVRAQEACWRDAEHAAVKLKALKTMLMVGALMCRKTNPEVVGGYNAFVTQNKAKLDAAATAVKLRFVKTAGTAKSSEAYSKFDTQLANAFAIEASRVGPDYCDQAVNAATLAVDAAAVDTLAGGMMLPAEVKACTVPAPAPAAQPVVAAASTTGAASAVATEPLPAAPAAPVEATPVSDPVQPQDQTGASPAPSIRL